MTPRLYVILGSAGSGRRELTADLIAGGFPPGESAVVWMDMDEKPDPGEARLDGLEGTRVERLGGGSMPVVPEGDGPVFWIMHGRRDPVDEVERLRDWLGAGGITLARIIGLVDCRLARAEPELTPWFDACVHFCDAVVLTRTEQVDNAWISTFIRRYEKQRLPCVFERLRKGRVRNPALLLDPQPRRISQVFDEDQLILPEGVVIEDEDSDEEDESLEPMIDPYFERLPGGRRVLQLPDIAEYLGEGGGPRTTDD